VAGVEIGQPRAMSRQRPDGVVLHWQVTPPQLDGPFGCALPFIIDWGASPHPTTSLTPGPRLVELRITTPRAEELRTVLSIVGALANVTVEEGEIAALHARVATARGEVTLSS
jgi:hypothetical protein